MKNAIVRLRSTVLTALASAALAMTVMVPMTVTSAMADPPRWAKAHGHKHHGHKHRDRYRGDWRRDNRRSDRRDVRVVRRTVHVDRQVNRQVYRDRPSSNLDLSGLNGGHLLGGILGAVVGNQFGKGSGKVAATIGGVVAGAFLGGEIGRSMQNSDRYQSQQALETAPTGRTIAWVNPDTGNIYRVKPTRTYQSDRPGAYCRDYTTWVLIDGYEERAQGTACRLPDGTWRPASS